MAYYVFCSYHEIARSNQRRTFVVDNQNKTHSLVIPSENLRPVDDEFGNIRLLDTPKEHPDYYGIQIKDVTGTNFSLKIGKNRLFHKDY